MAQEKYQVLILGHGEMGQAMEYWLRPRHDVVIWQRHPKSGPALDLSTTVARSDFVCFLPARRTAFRVGHTAAPGAARYDDLP